MIKTATTTCLASLAMLTSFNVASTPNGAGPFNATAPLDTTQVIDARHAPVAVIAFRGSAETSPAIGAHALNTLRPPVRKPRKRTCRRLTPRPCAARPRVRRRGGIDWQAATRGVTWGRTTA